MIRFASILTCPAALRRTHAGGIWAGIVAKQPVHPMRCWTESVLVSLMTSDSGAIVIIRTFSVKARLNFPLRWLGGEGSRGVQIYSFSVIWNLVGLVGAHIQAGARHSTCTSFPLSLMGLQPIWNCSGGCGPSWAQILWCWTTFAICPLDAVIVKVIAILHMRFELAPSITLDIIVEIGAFVGRWLNTNGQADAQAWGAPLCRNSVAGPWHQRNASGQNSSNYFKKRMQKHKHIIDFKLSVTHITVTRSHIISTLHVDIFI